MEYLLYVHLQCLEIDSPSRGRKHNVVGRMDGVSEFRN